MAICIIKRDSIDFLKALSKNNNRDWFNNHKARYVEANDNIIAFADALLAEMNKHDNIETPSGKKSVFRIYKDVRFSKDKTPYNTHWSASFKRATKKLRGGYYIRIEPGNSGLAGGFWGPDSDDMKRIRQDIDASYTDWEDLLGDQTLIETFGNLYGEQLGSAPRGYAKDHPAIHLLRYKQFMLRHLFSDEEVLSPDFLFRVNDVFKKMRPFLDFMSGVLTTDANGVNLVD
ncbi:MAG: DUF2461 domain-containing protein [Sphingobacteriales bacterium]